MAFIQQLMCVTVLVATVACQHGQNGGGYHYNSFSGPVSGAIRSIQVPVAAATQHSAPQHNQYNHHGQQQGNQQHTGTVDYVAKPDYSFAYGVEDPTTGNMQNHKETRDGDVVRGQYNVLQPDGSMRTVTYTADATNGFQATVHNTAPTIKQQQYATPTGQPHYTKPQYNNYNNNNNDDY